MRGPEHGLSAAAISIYLKEAPAQQVSLAILDQDGKTVATLKPARSAGLQQVFWNFQSENGELVAPAEYTARLQIGDQSWSRRLRVDEE